jgi:hypothetical protein
MKKIKLKDENLVGQDGLSRYINPNSEWEKNWDDADSNVIIYTDRLCFFDHLYESDKENYAWIIEPPIVNGEHYLNIVNHYSKFKKVFSHNKLLENKIPNFKFIPHGGTWLRDDEVNLFGKTKGISLIYSDKQWNAGHRFRHSIVDFIKAQGNQWGVEFFGSGSDRPIDFKIEALRDYKFSITIENSQEDDYFTEKILDCFLTGTVPIYFGTKNIGNYFNMDGVLTFDTHEQLLDILQNLNEGTYESMIEAVRDNYEIAKKYMHPETLINEEIQNG